MPTLQSPKKQKLKTKYHDPLGYLRRELLLGGLMPFDHNFFKPVPCFWRLLSAFNSPTKLYVDCGAGTGALVKFSQDTPIRMIGIDLMRRPKLVAPVLICDATRFPFNENIVAVFCRPSHDGWAYSAAIRARALGATVLYAGKPKNVRSDMPGRINLLARRVGMENESLYEIT